MDAGKRLWIGALLILLHIAVMIGVIALAVSVGGTAAAEELTPTYTRRMLHDELKARYPDGLPWATVNAWDVCFREGPGTEYPVRQHWSLGAAVEVLGEQDGWVQVLRWTSQEPLWVWGEYLDMV